MGSSATLTFWELLAVATGPALLTGLIGIFAPILAEEKRNRAERDRRRVEKFEEMVAAIFDLSDWMSAARDQRVFGTSPEMTRPSPLVKIEAISSIYYPELRSAVDALCLAATSHEKWQIEAGIERMKGEPEYTSGYKESYASFRQKQTALLEEVRMFAEKNFR